MRSCSEGNALMSNDHARLKAGTVCRGGNYGIVPTGTCFPTFGLNVPQRWGRFFHSRFRRLVQLGLKAKAK